MLRRRLKDCDKGSTLTEFAMVAPVFFLFVMGMIEYGYFFFKKNMLSHVLYEASRNIQTGEIQGATDPFADFMAGYCDDAVVALQCEQISFDVRAFDRISDVNFPEAQISPAGLATNFVFQPGNGSQITAMRVAVPHHFITPMMSYFFEPESGPAIVVGYTVAVNEPF
jgi:hypothetical protein